MGMLDALVDCLSENPKNFRVIQLQSGFILPQGSLRRAVRKVQSELFSAGTFVNSGDVYAELQQEAGGRSYFYSRRDVSICWHFSRSIPGVAVSDGCVRSCREHLDKYDPDLIQHPFIKLFPYAGIVARMHVPHGVYCVSDTVFQTFREQVLFSKPVQWITTRERLHPEEQRDALRVLYYMIKGSTPKSVGTEEYLGGYGWLMRTGELPNAYSENSSLS